MLFALSTTPAGYDEFDLHKATDTFMIRQKIVVPCQVIYDTTNWIVKNREMMTPEMDDLLSRSSNMLLQSIFSETSSTAFDQVTRVAPTIKFSASKPFAWFVSNHLFLFFINWSSNVIFFLYLHSFSRLISKLNQKKRTFLSKSQSRLGMVEKQKPHL